MANIKFGLDYTPIDGASITIKTPCDCTTVNGLAITYPRLVDGETVTSETVFTFKDAHGNDLSELGELFGADAYIKFILDTTNHIAYPQNADTNSYLEGKFDAITTDVTTLKNTAVTTSRKINNKALSSDITLSASDVSAVPTSRKVNGKALSSDITLSASDVSAVPTSRKVNGKALSSDITLSASDVGASDSSHNHDSSYFKKYDLNGCNVDSTGGNWTVDISENGHGTVPKTWVTVQQFTSGHFYTQIAQTCNSDGNTARIDGRMWIRNKYSSGAWGAWTVVYTDYTTKNEGINLGTGNGKIKGDVNGWIHITPNDAAIVARATTSEKMFYPATGDTWYLGGSNYRWKAVYGMSTSIATSDRNLKDNICEIDDKYVEFFDKLQPVTYELIGNDHDRTHIGFISQDVKESMDEVGLTDIDFAGYCKDKKTEPLFDEDNNYTGEKEILDADGNPEYIYSLRYGEFIALNTKMIQMNRAKIAEQQKEIDELKKAVAELTTKVNA